MESCTKCNGNKNKINLFGLSGNDLLCHTVIFVPLLWFVCLCSKLVQLNKFQCLSLSTNSSRGSAPSKILEEGGGGRRGRA